MLRLFLLKYLPEQKYQNIIQPFSRPPHLYHSLLGAVPASDASTRPWPALATDPRKLFYAAVLVCLPAHAAELGTGSAQMATVAATPGKTVF